MTFFLQELANSVTVLLYVQNGFKLKLSVIPKLLWTDPKLTFQYVSIHKFTFSLMSKNFSSVQNILNSDKLSQFRPFCLVRNSLVPISCWYYLTFTDMIRWISIVSDLFSLKYVEISESYLIFTLLQLHLTHFDVKN